MLKKIKLIVKIYFNVNWIGYNGANDKEVNQ